jgi:hypothetical protein
MVAFMTRKSESKTEVAAVPGQVQQLTVFGPPLLLEGEDAAAYDELLGRICAAVKPVDIIDEMFVVDIVSLEWEVLRWRRYKWSLIRARGFSQLEDFLARKLDPPLYFEDYMERLAGILQDNLPKEEADSAQTLVDKLFEGDAGAREKVIKVFVGIKRSLGQVEDDARADKARELVQEYVRREPDAVTLIDELLAYAGVSMDTFLAKVVDDKIDYIERIDRLTTTAETRRNAALHEIGRRRAVLSEALRRSVQKIEDDNFADGELVRELPPAEGQNAA